MQVTASGMRDGGGATASAVHIYLSLYHAIETSYKSSAFAIGLGMTKAAAPLEGLAPRRQWPAALWRQARRAVVRERPQAPVEDQRLGAGARQQRGGVGQRPALDARIVVQARL